MSKIKTTHKQIKDYWEQFVYEGDMGTDWAEALNHCWRCGNEYNTKSLHRCHIIPAQNGGVDDPSNFVLLCRACHEEAPSFYDDADVIWHWIKHTSCGTYGEYWFKRTLKEFESIFKREPDLSKLSLKNFKKIVVKSVGIHWGTRAISLSSYAYAMLKAGA